MFGLVRPSQVPARTPYREPQRWDPWSEMDQVRQQFDDLVTRSFGLTPLSRLIDPGATLPVELYETADQFVLRAHLPGLSREDLNLQATANKITLWGERRPQTPENAKVLANTAAWGRFQFEYALPVEIKSDEVKAAYRNGILEVTLPKIEAARPQSVQVAIEG
jgi:HSP20 family protein